MHDEYDAKPRPAGGAGRRTGLKAGLYLITPDEADSARLLGRVTPLLPFAACLQYRNKTAGTQLRAQQAAGLQALCAAADVPLIVNDDVWLALSVGAAGVHLGHDDGDIAAARNRLGQDAIIGASCYDDLRRAVQATSAGADYLAFGAFFPSPNKPHARRASPSLLRDAAALGLSRVAIGGITPDNAGSLIAAGADLIALISGVFDASDPVAAARACQALFGSFGPANRNRFG